MGDLAKRYEQSLKNAHRIHEAARRYAELALDNFYRAVNKYLIEKPLEEKIAFVSDHLLFSLTVGMAASRKSFDMGSTENTSSGVIISSVAFGPEELQGYFTGLFSRQQYMRWKDQIDFINYSIEQLFEQVPPLDYFDLGMAHELLEDVYVDFIIREQGDIGYEAYLLDENFADFYRDVHCVLNEKIDDIMWKNFHGESIGVARICDFYHEDFRSFYGVQRAPDWWKKLKDPECVMKFLRYKMEEYLTT